MKTPWRLAAVMIAFAVALPPAGAATFKATYDTVEAGPMTLEFDGNGAVAGAYPDFHGRLEGTLKDRRRIEGVWWQTQASADDLKCTSEVNGSPYWGRFVLLEDADAQGFHGRWGNCNDEPSETWSGQLRAIPENGS